MRLMNYSLATIILLVAMALLFPPVTQPTRPMLVSMNQVPQATLQESHNYNQVTPD